MHLQDFMFPAEPSLSLDDKDQLSIAFQDDKPQNE
jgi:hypothetical protein